MVGMIRYNVKKFFGYIKEFIRDKTRPPLQSDNLNDTLKLNRFLANPFVIIMALIVLDYMIWTIINIGYNFIGELPEIIRNFGKAVKRGEHNYSVDLYQLLTQRRGFSDTFMYLFYGFLFFLDIRLIYAFRVSFSEKAMNKGQEGTERWTTLEEIKKQYKKVDMYPSTFKEVKAEESHYLETVVNGGKIYEPYLTDNNGKRILKIICDKKTGQPIKTVIREHTNYFKGKGGVPVSRWGDFLYIDYQLTNNLFFGTTRSGKGEMFAFQVIDNLSRAENQIDRPSMIIFDPKLEIYKSSAQTLRDRGYIVRLLNLDNPLKSAGYNPLTIITEYYKRGKINEAQQLAKSFSFNIFNSNNDNQEPIWKNTATDLFTALIMAVLSDNIALDEELNYNRREKFLTLKKLFDDTDESEKEPRREKFRQLYFQVEENDGDILSEILDKEIYESELYWKLLENGIGIPDYIVLEDNSKIYFSDIENIYPNERKINCFSVINFFQRLVNIKTGSDKREGAEKVEVALDNYFNARNHLDYARTLYSEIKTAGDRTKGSVYINMQSSLTIFAQDNIARLTAESDIDIKSLGFDKKKPTVVFIGIPTEDKSNHFIATTFVTQSFQYLWKLAKEGKQVLGRNLVYILDELGNMPTLDNFASMVTNSLGAGISFNIFIQSYNQLKAKYGIDEDTIKDNFANQFYILTAGHESSEAFSKNLGSKTIIEVQRSGMQFSKNKTITENNKERPLKYPAELRHLREGETAIIRVAKRTDRAGASVKSYPILTEYQDNVYFTGKVKAFIKTINKRWILKEKGRERDTKNILSFLQEYDQILSDIKRQQGTAFLYRYQYMAYDFPNPTEIEFSKVFNEKGREEIDYQNRVCDITKILHKLGIAQDLIEEVKPMDIKFKYLQKEKYYKFDAVATKYLGLGYKDYLNISLEDKSKEVLQKIKKYIENLDDEEKYEMKKADFIGQLQKIIIM